MTPPSERPSVEVVGVIGLGNMGHVLAENLAAAGHPLVVHDAAGPARAPRASRHVASVAEVAEGADVIVLSLPDGAAGASVARAVAAAPRRRVHHVVDTSTVGVEAATAIAAALAEAGVGYVDAPVSGGPAGARARTLAVMVAGAHEACAAVEPVLAGLSDRRFRVGDAPGMGQAMKLANNFLSATALAATSEALAFGRSVGLDPATMVEVLDQSSGRSSATNDKFPAHVLTGRYASGFANTLMAKDLALYLGAVHTGDGPDDLGRATTEVWTRFAGADPGVDFTRIFPFVAERAAADDPGAPR